MILASGHGSGKVDKQCNSSDVSCRGIPKFLRSRPVFEWFSVPWLRVVFTNHAASTYMLELLPSVSAVWAVVEEGWVSCSGGSCALDRLVGIFMQGRTPAIEKVNARQGRYLFVWSQLLQCSSTACRETCVGRGGRRMQTISSNGKSYIGTQWFEPSLATALRSCIACPSRVSQSRFDAFARMSLCRVFWTTWLLVSLCSLAVARGLGWVTIVAFGCCSLLVGSHERTTSPTSRWPCAIGRGSQ